jgi:hypothetical protein
MIYTAPYVMLLMWANPLRGQVGGGWALEIETFLALGNGIELLGDCHLGPKKSLSNIKQIFSNQNYNNLSGIMIFCREVLYK